MDFMFLEIKWHPINIGCLSNYKGFQSVSRVFIRWWRLASYFFSWPWNQFLQAAGASTRSYIGFLFDWNLFWESVFFYTMDIGYFFLHQSAQYFTFLNLCGEVRTRSGKEVVVRARNEKRSRSTVGSNSLRCASSLRSRLVYSWDCIWYTWYC